MEKECPVCGKSCDIQGLENHIRLTNGRGHGPAGSMPDEGADGGATLSATDGPISATEDLVRGSQSGEKMAIQEAADQAFAEGSKEVRQVDARVVALERQVQELAKDIAAINERERRKCPKCGHDEPEAIEGSVAEAYAEYRDVYDWVCPNCKEPFNA